MDFEQVISEWWTSDQLNTFWTYLSSLLDMIAIAPSNHAQKWGQICWKSVQLVRGSSFINDLLQNPYFKKYAFLCNPTKTSKSEKLLVYLKKKTHPSMSAMGNSTVYNSPFSVISKAKLVQGNLCSLYNSILLKELFLGNLGIQKLSQTSLL